MHLFFQLVSRSQKHSTPVLCWMHVLEVWLFWLKTALCLKKKKKENHRGLHWWSCVTSATMNVDLHVFNWWPRCQWLCIVAKFEVQLFFFFAKFACVFFAEAPAVPMQWSHWNEWGCCNTALLLVWTQPRLRGMWLWLAVWWLSLLLPILNVIFPLAVQGVSVCWACCSLCGDQRDPQNSPHTLTEEVTQPDPARRNQVYWSSLRPLRTQQTGPDETRLGRVVHQCTSSDKSRHYVAPLFPLLVCPLCRWFCMSIGLGKVIP